MTENVANTASIDASLNPQNETIQSDSLLILSQTSDRSDILSPGSDAADLPKDVSPSEPEGSLTTSGSEKTVKPSGIPAPKTSGLKQPSKIGRPCSGQAKPALPPVPTKNSPDFDRRDDYRRQKLTDVEEEVDEYDVFSYGRRSTSPSPRKTRNYSVSSNMSMDTLWDLHPRRLSEAGLRRYSDTSVVLTENTDLFIIGMRVWVGGTKPGQIAYIGETQFAPGEWAGIVLDEPIGKNDGSVSGTRYFQCEPKKGVFSRLTRLTMSPLSDVTLESSIMRTPANGTRRSPISPTGSTKSLLRPTPSLNTSMTSLSSSFHDTKVKIGDRVIVQSSQGSKPGTLRYIGTTEFAKGEWCGVELDDPLGKNDGAVEGKRYFVCQPKFGLFAPLSKVSKSPSSRKPGSAQCVIHRGSTSGLTTPTPILRRQGSRESMSSMVSATSAASGVRRVRLGVTSLASAKKSTPKTASTPVSKSPLQDVIREKEHHIEQLLKEREIDRSEISRAAEIAERAEGQLLTLQQEYEKYRLESEAKFKEHSLQVTELEKQRQQLIGQLEDEKKKLEDAQFRFEEESLTKDDIEAANQTHLTKIKELEEKLTNEITKNEKLEQETKKLFETEEILSKIQEEMENIQKLQAETAKSLEIKNAEMLTLKEKLEEANQLLIQEQEKLKEKSKDMETVISENNILLQEKESSIVKLKEELNNANKLLKEKHIGNEIILLKELKKTEMDLSAKTYDCESNLEEIKELKKKILNLENDLKSVQLSESETEKEKRLKNNIEEIRGILRSTVSELLKVRKEYAIELLEKEMTLREKDIKLNYEILEMQKVRTDFAQTIAELTQNSKSCRDRYAKHIESRNQQIEELLNNLQKRSKELITRQIHSNKLETELAQNSIIISKLKSEIESYYNKQSEQNNYIAKLLEELKTYKLKANEFERKFINAEKTIQQLKDIKQQHELQFKSIIESSKDSNAQLAIINEELRKVEQSMDNLKIEMSKKLDAAAKTEQELQFSLQSTIDQHKIEKNHLEQQLQAIQNSEIILKEKLQTMTSEFSETQQKLEYKITEFTKNIECNELEYKSQIEVKDDKIKELEQILEVAVAENHQVTSELSRRIEVLVSERDQLKTSLKEKVEQLVEAQEQVKDYLTNQDAAHEKQLTTFKTEIEQYKTTINETTLKIQQQSEEIKTLTDLKSNLEKQLEEHLNQIKKLNEEKSSTDQSYTKIKTDLQQTEEKLSTLTSELSTLKEEKINFERVINEHQTQITSLTNDVKNLQNEKNNIQNTIKEKEEELVSITKEIKQIQSDNLSLKSSLTEKDNKLTALTKQLEEIIKEKGTTSETFAAQENKILELNMELQKITQEKNDLLNKVMEKTQEIEKLNETINKTKSDLNNIIQNKESDITNLNKQIDSLKTEQQNTTKSLTDKNQNMVNITNELEVIKSEKAKLEENIKTNEETLQKTKTELENILSKDKINSEKITALENTVKEKENKLNELNNQLQKMKEEWDEPLNNPLVKQLTSKIEESEKLLQEKNAEIKAINERIQAIIKEQGTGSEIISAQESQITELKSTIEQLTNEKNKLTNEIKEESNKFTKLKEETDNGNKKHSEAIKEKEDQILQIKEQLSSLEIEKQNAIVKLQNNEETIQKLLSDSQSLQNTKTDLENKVKETENKLTQFKNEVEKSNDNKTLEQVTKISELENIIKQKEKSITDLQTELNKLKQQWDEPDKNPLIKDIKSQLENKEKSLIEKETELSSLNTQVTKLDQQNQQIQQSWQCSIQQWKIKLQNLENIRQIAATQCDSLEEQVKLLTTQTENAQKIKDVKPLHFEEFKKQIDNDREELHAALEKTQTLLIEKEKELSLQRNNYLKLENQLKQTEQKIAAASKIPAVSGIPKPGKKQEENKADVENYQKIIEEKELAVGQIDFLNSIIVDMKQKNEELLSKIKLLENGYLEDSPPRENINNRVIPPRQYCDICEMFDLHETEDCPVQMTDDPVVVRDENVKRVVPEPRPYCDICEEFGHNTENCDADETY